MSSITPVTPPSSPVTAFDLNGGNSPSDIQTRTRTNAIGESVLGASPETTPPTSLIEKCITSFNGTPVENLSPEAQKACAYNILRNA